MDKENEARVKLEQQRWGGTPVCPFCGGLHIYKHSPTHSYRCSTCGKYFTVRTGTIMEGSKVPLHKWLRAIHILHDFPSIPADLFCSLLEVNVRTATTMMHKIREKYHLYT